MTKASRSQVELALRLVAANDSTVTESRIARALAALDGQLDAVDVTGGASNLATADAVLARPEVAALLKVTPRTVTNLAKRGLLRKIGWGDGKRANGYSRRSVEELIARGMVA